MKEKKFVFTTEHGSRIEGRLLKGFVVLYVAKDYWIASKGYKLYRYNVEEGKWAYYSEIVDKLNALLSIFRLLRRLFRAEITRLYRFKGGNWICIAKKGLFRYDVNDKRFHKCHVIEKGSRPMALCQSGNGTIYYGEYCYNPQRNEIRVFQSKDDGFTWGVAYTFEKGKINHIHGIFNDLYSGEVWVATGDDDEACIFGYTDDEFKTFNERFKGSQQYRVCVPLFTPDKIIYATDSQYEQNVIRSIDKGTGKITNLCEIQGSGIYAVKIGLKMVVSTTIEPSLVNREQVAHLWYSEDGYQWNDILSFKKDIWEKTYFQFGSIRFPNYEEDSGYLIITGRALQKLDGNTLIIPTSELNKNK